LDGCYIFAAHSEDFQEGQNGSRRNPGSAAAAALPSAVILIAVVYFVTARAFPSERQNVSGAKAFLSAELRRMGRPSPGEIKTALITLAAVIL
jgi:di/tricarboxylate transporter